MALTSDHFCIILMHSLHGSGDGRNRTLDAAKGQGALAVIADMDRGPGQGRKRVSCIPLGLCSRFVLVLAQSNKDGAV